MSTTRTKHLSSSSFSQQRRDQGKDSALVAGLLSDFDRLLENQGSADVEFLIDQERVAAHRLIVVARCDRYRTKKRLNKPPSNENTPLTIQLGKHFSAAAVRDVVRYLYTGKISLHNEAPFSLLQVCAEFGLPLLQSYLTRHVTSHLTPETVCQTLAGASSLMKSCRDDSLKLALKQIVQESNSYVITHTRSVIEARGHLSLPKETFIGIISSNALLINEEEVWQAVVQWGQHKAGVDRSSDSWTEGERSSIKDALEGVLDQVRLMDISSDVFAKEVEPTGLLPMEMTLARYRHAATTGDRKGSEGRIMGPCPRGGVQDPFADTAILAGKLEWQFQILEWIDSTSSQQCPTQDWVLLYRGSRDGFNAHHFHTSCDDKGSSITVIKTPDGCLFGGYTDMSWTSRFKRGKYISSQNSFLFSLVGPMDTPPTKFPLQQPSYAINSHPGIGPIFGSGADLFVSNDCDSSMESYSQLGHSYGDPALPLGHLTGEQYFNVEDIEVFGVSA